MYIHWKCLMNCRGLLCLQYITKRYRNGNKVYGANGETCINKQLTRKRGNCECIAT